MNFEFLDLRAFIAVADLGSFHRAAKSLNLSQPALSRRIQKLEEEPGRGIARAIDPPCCPDHGRP